MNLFQQIRLIAGNYALSKGISSVERNIQDSILVHTWHAYSNSSTFPDMAKSPWLTLNKKYTATAKYLYYAGKTYITIDSATPRVQFDKSLCKNPCYYIYDKTLNLKLKYD